MTLRQLPITLFLAVIALTFHGLHAEEYNYAPRDYSIIPPTPEVASLLDFKEYPVDYFRGIPEISYPIFTLKSGSITIPIVLRYHGGGIRTLQQYGNAGLGWDVTYGAVIGHSVCGAPDDASNSDRIHGLWHLNSVEKSFRTKLIAKTADYDPMDPGYTRDKYNWIPLEGQRYLNGLTDVANDIFNLSGLGMSAVFAFDTDKKIVQSSETPLVIERSYGLNGEKEVEWGCDYYGFLVTDNNGIIYKFKTQDRSRHDYFYGDPTLKQQEDTLLYASAWHLDEVSDLCGNKVRYSYIKGGRSDRSSGSKVVRMFNTEQLMKKEPQSLNSCHTTRFYPKVVSEITSGDITVKFNYLTLTFDTQRVPLISSIVITDKNGDTRTFSFNYMAGNIPLLTSVVEQGETILKFNYDKAMEPDWTFDYFNQDFGGYNNENPVASLVPTVANVGDDANRGVSPTAAKKGVLNRITYPTGGYTELEWENNTFSYLGPVPVKGNVNTGNGSVAISFHTDTLRMCLDENFKKLKIENLAIGANNEVSLDLREYFYFDPTLLFNTDYHHSHDFELENYSDGMPPYYPHVRFKKQNANNSCKVFFLDKETVEDTGGTITFNLEPGTYSVELVHPTEISNAKTILENNMRYGNSQSGKIYIHTIVRKNIISGEDSNTNLWCGLRIKRITSSAGDGEEPIRKDFYYNTAFDPYMTTGTVHMLPQYMNNYSIIYSQETGYDGGEGYQGAGVVCVGTTAFPNSLFGNYSSIEYPEIATCLSKEDPQDPDSYLREKTEKYYYSSVRQSGNMDFNRTDFLGYQPVGERMNTSMAHRRGNMMKKVIGNYSGLNSQTTSFRYNIYESSLWDDDLPVLTTSAFTLCDMTRAPNWNTYGGHDYSIGKYSIIPYTKTIASETVEERGGIIAEKNYEYFYDGYTNKLDYGLVKSISTTTSEGNAVSTRFTYPYNNESRIFLPEKETEVTTIDGTVISAVRNEYAPDTRLLLRKYELPANASTSELLSSNQWTTSKQRENISSLTYEYRYNSNGNLIEIKYRGIPLVSYLWGYNGMYPIIEAAGVSYDTLQSALLSAGVTQQQIEGRSVDSQTRIRAIADNLRSSLPEATVSSIAYHWLLGIIEMTDGNGRSTSYDYDNRGRLTEVRDFNNYLIQKHDYNTYGYANN